MPRRSCRLAALFALAAPTTALVAHGPMVRGVVAPHASRATGPQMLFGGAGAGKGFRSVFKSVPRLPRIPGLRGPGMNGADGGGGGGTAGGSTSSGDNDKDGGDNPFAAALKQYDAAVQESPLLMKALTSLTGFAIGDILAQKFIQKGDFDWFRLFRMSSFGFLIHGTSSHWFYGMLDGKIPGTDAKSVFTKVFIDQVLWNPCFGIMFFSYVAMLENKGLQYVVDKTRNELLTQVTGSWKVWPLAHTINFKYIQPSQRVLYINSIQIGYNCFLSLIANRDAEPAAKKKKA